MLAKIVLILLWDVTAAFLLKGNVTQADMCEDVTYVNCKDTHVCGNPDLKKLCPVTCGVCIPPSKCVDAKFINCTDSHVCGEKSLRTFCPLTCGLCTTPTPKPFPTCVDSTFVTCSDPHVCVDPVLKTLCPLTCGICGGNNKLVTTSLPCVDKDPAACKRYTTGICTRFLNFALTNCQATCKLCGKTLATQATTLTTTISPPKISASCMYKGSVYQEHETWNDGCTYRCVCEDGNRGFYRCHQLCSHWDLPSVCTMNPPAAGKCCPQPSCPSYVTIKYPPGYTIQ